MLHNKYIYYFLSFTWGSILSIPGIIIAFFFYCFGCPIVKNKYGWSCELKNISNCGFSLGPFSFISENLSEYWRNHEFGHSIQNCIFGPFTIFIVILPSVFRFWYMKIKNITFANYDSIWFESQATKFGEKY